MYYRLTLRKGYKMLATGGGEHISAQSLPGRLFPMTTLAKTTIGSVRTANIIPPMLAPKIKVAEEYQEEENDAKKQN